MEKLVRWLLQLVRIEKRFIGMGMEKRHRDRWKEGRDRSTLIGFSPPLFCHLNWLVPLSPLMTKRNRSRFLSCQVRHELVLRRLSRQSCYPTTAFQRQGNAHPDPPGYPMKLISMPIRTDAAMHASSAAATTIVVNADEMMSGVARACDACWL